MGRTSTNAWRVGRDALIATVACSVIGLAFNAIRSDGIPLVASEAYDLFVPCPEPLGEVEGLAVTDPWVQDDRSLRIDARSPEEFAAWHLSGARNVPFDYLEGVPDEVVRQVAASGAVRVVVYGDGGNPDSGRELARELAGRGVRHVFFVQGGAPALRSSGREVPTGGAEEPR
ncbi:MAG TPA: rhodanese-like domain-containing protein [Myxococcota bacterium]|nr:rhodanese-like domain-containing protein [Myxococcota bacterium]HQK51721.1 rhodanese-like domain-containing protein [Myxococcota bacterium]